ncbi:MAG: sensor histidine kinase [Chitinophagaceae bacterium]
MKRGIQNIWLACILIVITNDTIAQTKEIDSLHQLAAISKPSKQFDLYLDLASHTRDVNPDSAVSFANKALDLAQKANSDDQKMLAFFMLGRIITVKGNYHVAIKYFEESLQLSQPDHKDSVTALSLNGIGSCLWQLGKHAEALENHFKALNIRERIGDSIGVGISKVNIGMVYQTQEKLPLAEKYIREALGIFKRRTEISSQISATHTLANIYGMQGKIKEAFLLDEEGIVMADKIHSEFSKALFFDNMGNCYLYNNPPDYKKAFYYFTRTLEIDSAFENKKQMSDSYSNLGGVFFEQKKFAEAIPYFQRSVMLADESGYTQGKLKTLQLLSRAYGQSGRTNEALASLQAAMNIKDSLVNSVSEDRIAEMQTVYETEKKQQQINLQQAQLSKKNLILIATISLAILLALLGISAWLRYRLKQKSRLQSEIIHQQEIATHAVIKAEENERQRIARDLHDGVGQMMSAAKMNLSAFESDIQFSNKEEQASFEKIIGLVDESCKEIRSVSHNMMPNALLKNNLAAAIMDFTDKIEKKSLQIHLYTDGLDERLDATTEIVFYRIIQECVNNVIKHAQATTLDISIIKDKEGISATIEDNGKGFDISAKENAEGIGLKNIVTRVEYLKGTIEFDSSPGRGTLIAINVPHR